MKEKLKKHNVVMLPTNEASKIHIFTDGTIGYINVPNLTYGRGSAPQHLYIVSSDEVIKGRDWFIGSRNQVLQCKDAEHAMILSNAENPRKKIVATTDPELHSKWEYSERAKFEMEMLDKAGSGYISPIPETWKHYTQVGIAKIPQDFIAAYIKAYNEDNPITEVMLEVFTQFAPSKKNYSSPMEMDSDIPSSKEVPKFRSNGSVIIHRVKEQKITTHTLYSLAHRLSTMSAKQCEEFVDNWLKNEYKSE